MVELFTGSKLVSCLLSELTRQITPSTENGHVSPPIESRKSFGGGKKKKSDSEFLSYNLMLNSGKKIRDKKNNYSNSRVVRKHFSERNKKP